MQMWQEMEESPSARSRSCQQQQQPPTRRSGVSRRHHGGGGPYMPPYGPPAFLPPGLPPHTLFGGGGGSASGGRHGHGHGHGFMPQSIMALREAVVGMQRTGLPPQLLFSDRDFTAGGFMLHVLCRWPAPFVYCFTRLFFFSRLCVMWGVAQHDMTHALGLKAWETACVCCLHGHWHCCMVGCPLHPASVLQTACPHAPTVFARRTMLSSLHSACLLTAVPHAIIVAPP